MLKLGSDRVGRGISRTRLGMPGHYIIEAQLGWSFHSYSGSRPGDHHVATRTRKSLTGDAQIAATDWRRRFYRNGAHAARNKAVVSGDGMNQLERTHPNA